MQTGRPKTELRVTADERHTLEQWARRPKTAQALARCARLVLACATGKTNRTVATELKTTGQTSGVGGDPLWGDGWTGCWMSRAPAPRDAPAMRRWSGF